MFVTLGSNPHGKKHDPSNPVDLLLDCHERIRRFSSMGVRLATAEAPPAEIAEVAARVHRYFTVALPLHVADEDTSIRPRLLALHPPQELVDALGTMAREHVEIEDLLLELTTAWDTLKTDPARRASFGELARASSHLEELLRNHLTLEEEIIVPSMAKLLPPEATAEIVREMRARRAGPGSGR